MAELGWTRKAIKTVLGVTPTTMRPPYGDIGRKTVCSYLLNLINNVPLNRRPCPRHLPRYGYDSYHVDQYTERRQV